MIRVSYYIFNLLSFSNLDTFFLTWEKSSGAPGFSGGDTVLVSDFYRLKPCDGLSMPSGSTGKSRRTSPVRCATCLIMAYFRTGWILLLLRTIRLVTPGPHYPFSRASTCSSLISLTQLWSIAKVHQRWTQHSSYYSTY